MATIEVEIYGELGAGIGLPAVTASVYFVKPLPERTYNKWRQQIENTVGYDILGELRNQARCR